MLSLGKMMGRLPRRFWGMTAVAMLLVGGGCATSTTYHVEIWPTADGYVRSVEVASHPTPEAAEGESPPPAVQERERQIFLAVYGEGKRTADTERFERAFSEDTPDDVGGSGSLVRWSSELGDVLVYHERFRGRLPTLGERLTRQAAIDHLTQWIVGWLDEELAGLEGADDIKRFVADDLRTDLQDLVCLLEITGAEVSAREPENAVRHSALLVGHFLIERGYLSINDLAQLPLISQDNDKLVPWAVERFRRKLAQASGLAVDAPALSLLDDPEAMPHRFERYLRQTAEYRLWCEQRVDAEDHCPVDASTFLGEALSPVTGPLFAGLLAWRGPDQLTLVLHTAMEPIETNGKWDSDATCVRWDWRLSPRRSLEKDESWLYSGLPRIAFAQWAQPDSDRQTALFGEVLIHDESLRDYCVWRQGLDADQAAYWQELLSRLPLMDPENRMEMLLGFDEHWTEESEIPAVVKQVAQGLVARLR